MSEDFGSGNSFPNPIAIGNIRFIPNSLSNFGTGTRISSRQSAPHQSVTLPHRPDELRERLPEILEQLHSLKPLCCSGNQRELARKALTALKNRSKEDNRNLAKRLADNVAGTVD